MAVGMQGWRKRLMPKCVDDGECAGMTFRGTLPEGDCIPFRNASGPGVLLMRVETSGKELKNSFPRRPPLQRHSCEGRNPRRPLHKQKSEEEKAMRFNALQQGPPELADSHLDSCLRGNDEFGAAPRFFSQV